MSLPTTDIFRNGVDRAIKRSTTWKRGDPRRMYVDRQVLHMDRTQLINVITTMALEIELDFDPE